MAYYDQWKGYRGFRGKEKEVKFNQLNVYMNEVKKKSERERKDFQFREQL